MRRIIEASRRPLLLRCQIGCAPARLALLLSPAARPGFSPLSPAAASPRPQDDAPQADDADDLAIALRTSSESGEAPAEESGEAPAVPWSPVLVPPETDSVHRFYNYISPSRIGETKNARGVGVAGARQHRAQISSSRCGFCSC